ncbi:hypothetical protein M011DRAFT_468692 [Sporormia fimetaria CBS 119925]|uniref:Uncharacterized protein n=1 Tax=Sporormia fimetaria CBS 119925 TaxID=1340428 RepID=A0A6A6V935_9PLEO|nr:hypothetical protein M011DRAFT_468692 [Sporormia fimetaria CBS 119925]
MSSFLIYRRLPSHSLRPCSCLCSAVRSSPQAVPPQVLSAHGPSPPTTHGQPIIRTGLATKPKWIFANALSGRSHLPPSIAAASSRRTAVAPAEPPPSTPPPTSIPSQGTFPVFNFSASAMEFFEAFGNIIEKTSPPSTRLRTTAADGWPSPRGATTYMHSDADGPIHGAALDTGMNSVYQSTESSVPSAPSDTKSKPVRFELILPHAPHQRGRLPMRVQILPGDNTSDIIDTIRSFYGIYKPWGVSLEDSDGNTLIASFDNFRHNMVVYVRVTDGVDMDDYATDHKEPFSRRPSQAIDGHHMHHIAHDHGPTSRSYSKLGSTQLNSPQPGRGRRSESVQKSMTRSRGHSSHSKLPGPAEEHEYDSASDGSDRRGKKEQVASAEISVDNIVEGGRRKRAKFDSSVSGLMDAVSHTLTWLSVGVTIVPTTPPAAPSVGFFDFAAKARERI